MKQKLIGNLDGLHEITCDQIDDHFYLLLKGAEGDSVIEADASFNSNGSLSLIINHQSFDIDIEPVKSSNLLDGSFLVKVNGRLVELEMLDERRFKMKEAMALSSPTHLEPAVSSPMPGKVLRILVKEGQEVEEGMGLVVIEAMKMENELKSPKSALVQKLLVAEGDLVESGQQLIQF